MIEKIPFFKVKLHILICINDRSHLPEPKLPDCGPQVSQDDIKALKLWVRDEKLLRDVKITQTKCLGACSEKGSIFMVYPDQEYYVYDSIDEIKDFIISYLQKEE